MSRVGAVAIAVLFFLAVVDAFYAVWLPLSAVLAYLTTPTMMLGVPLHPAGLTFQEHVLLTTAFPDFIFAAVSIVAGVALSRFVYGAGPIRVLRTLRGLLDGRNHA